MRVVLILMLILSTTVGHGQYEDYKSYETFSELDKWERDYGLVFAPSLMYTKVTENNEITGTTATDRSRNLLFYDLQLGYIFRNGFYFGVLYTGESQDINTSSPTTTRSSLGATFGYIKYGWAFRGTFFPYSKQSLENATEATYTEGMGYQLDAAYYFRLGRYFSVGPQFVFKSFRYGKAENATTSVNTDATSQHDVFTPMLSLLINLYRG